MWAATCTWSTRRNCTGMKTNEGTPEQMAQVIAREEGVQTLVPVITKEHPLVI